MYFYWEILLLGNALYEILRSFPDSFTNLVFRPCVDLMQPSPYTKVTFMNAVLDGDPRTLYMCFLLWINREETCSNLFHFHVKTFSCFNSSNCYIFQCSGLCTRRWGKRGLLLQQVHSLRTGWVLYTSTLTRTWQCRPAKESIYIRNTFFPKGK